MCFRKTENVGDNMMCDTQHDFPILKQTARGKSLVYLDSGATAQKPQCVIDAISQYYVNENANVHRGVYELSERATKAYEDARITVQHFIHAAESKEIIFTKGTTEAINLVAQSYGQQYISEGDEIILSTLEHHSNIVPWQMLCEQRGAVLKIIRLTEDGTLDQTHYESLLNHRTKLVALIHASNVLGTINPVKEMIAKAHAKKVPVLLDGAQAIPHMPVDVQDLDCDFYVFSSHKFYGPTGVGVLYGKAAYLDAMPPYQGGGDMIRQVTFEKTTYNNLPYKFEAGTPNMAGVVGLRAAIDYMHQIGFQKMMAHEHCVLKYALEALPKVPGLRIVGMPPERVPVISFVMQAAHPHDIGTILDDEGVAIRAGHHCAMPLMQHLKLPATARISLGIYNQVSDIDRLVEALGVVNRLLGDG